MKQRPAVNVPPPTRLLASVCVHVSAVRLVCAFGYLLVKLEAFLPEESDARIGNREIVDIAFAVLNFF